MIRRARHACLTVFAALFGFAAPALADVAERAQVGMWLMEANYQRGDFQNCTISAPYGANAEVLFLLTREISWGMGIKNTNWNLNTGNTGTVRFRVDQQVTRSATAKALSRSLLLVPLPDSRALFEEIRWGNYLYLDIGDETFNLTLKGTAVALDALMNCVRRHR